MVDQQVLTPLDEGSIFATHADESSIMCYQLPGDITVDGRPILGGLDINTTDRTFARRIYPPAETGKPRGAARDYEEAGAPLVHWDEFVEQPIFVE